MGNILSLGRRYSGTIIFMLVEAGLEMSPYQSLPLAISLWSLAGLWAIVATIGLFRKKESSTLKRKDKSESLKRKGEKHIPDLLWKMHNRMMKFAEIRMKQDIDKKILYGAMEILADRVDLVKLEDSKKVQRDIKKQLGLGTRLPKSEKKVEELSLKLAGLTRAFPMPEKQWDLKDMIKIGESLDGSKVGVGNLRDLDTKWQRWYKELTSLQQNYADEQLDKCVSASIFISYGCCSLLLYTTYIYRFGNNEIMSKMMSVVRSETANIRVQVNDAIRDSMRLVINRIKELESSENLDEH